MRKRDLGGISRAAILILLVGSVGVFAANTVATRLAANWHNRAVARGAVAKRNVSPSAVKSEAAKFYNKIPLAFEE
ncbi:MAG TPA: hypothetical protein VMT58_08320, partial [Candidatus Binataceae bacterium]|nr:hypothetical protein [Candidatus Binataceae bacterium]